ncbi:unnamed protein product [Ectocarpus sp. 12 AP-2014]
MASALCLLSSWACFFTWIFSFQTWRIRAFVDPLRASIDSSSLLRRVRSVLLSPRASLTSRTRGRGVQEGTWTMDPSQESRWAPSSLHALIVKLPQLVHCQLSL